MTKDKREKGSATQTTGFVVLWGERKIALYQSGRAHAGINLAELLEKRATVRSEMITMSDALSANPHFSSVCGKRLLLRR